jgi:hypothetical protein
MLPQLFRKPLEKLERETGFEPATDGLGSRCATTALLPPAKQYRRLASYSQRPDLLFPQTVTQGRLAPQDTKLKSVMV